MGIRFSAFYTLLSGVCSLAVAGPADIRLPDPIIVPDKMPPPVVVDPVTRLNGDEIYVVDSDTPCIVLVSPAGVVAVSEESGPIRIRGKFVGGTGQVESKTFRGKQVFLIEGGILPGKVEVLVIPQGATKATDIIRRTLSVNEGKGPRPPPVPDTPADVVKASKVAAVIVYDRLNADPEIAAAVTDGKFRDFLSAGKHTLEVIDSGAPVGKVRAALFDPFRKSAGLEEGKPYIVLMDPDSKPPMLVVSVVPLPKTGEGIVSAIKSVTGGK